MRWGRSDISTKNLRRNSPRFRFSYFDYCLTIQKVKAQTREINIRPQILKASRLLSHHISYRSLSLKSLCFLHEFANLLRGVID